MGIDDHAPLVPIRYLMFAAVIQPSCTSDWFPSRRNGADPSSGSSGSRIGRPHVSRFPGTCHTFPGSGTTAPTSKVAVTVAVVFLPSTSLKYTANVWLVADDSPARLTVTGANAFPPDWKKLLLFSNL